MNAAENPNWVWFKRQFNESSWLAKLVIFSLRFIAMTSVWFLTKSQVWTLVTLFSSAILPDLLIFLIDTYLRVQFSLLAMLIAILTLQLPVMLFFTAETGIGIGLGISLLLIWLLVFGAYVKIRIAIAKEDSAERAAMEKRLESPRPATQEPA